MSSSDLAQRISRVRYRIERASSRVNSDPGGIILVAVTKTVPPEIIRQAIGLGLNTFGENKVQEAKTKINKLGLGQVVSWHMIGHLQTNKVKDAVEVFNLIHSVDSIKLCEEINKRADKAGKTVDILFELNLSGEKTKYGFSEKELLDAILSMEKYSRIRMLGLMTMTPLSDNPEDSRPYFQRLFNLKKEISGKALPLNVEMKYLSMGMTQDFEVAIEEGANIVRIGRAIFSGDFLSKY